VKDGSGFFVAVSVDSSSVWFGNNPPMFHPEEGGDKFLEMLMDYYPAMSTLRYSLEGRISESCEKHYRMRSYFYSIFCCILLCKSLQVKLYSLPTHAYEKYSKYYLC
jgi:hypothetical protein